MSLFLGKIHYWLYNKIQMQESILEEVSKLSVENINTIFKDAENLFGEPVTSDLENSISHDNIHGWLQERVTSVESRLAYVTTKLNSIDNSTKEQIKSIFVNNAVSNAKKIEIEINEASNMYQLVYDFILEGMPCDRVNEVIENTEDKIKWEMTIDIHKTNWDKSNGDVNIYHEFINEWIATFINEVNPAFKYEVDGNTKTIVRS